jgi:hypothetical protein
LEIDMIQALLGAGLLLLSTTATAEASDREGFLIGFALGGGTCSCWDCESSSAGALGLHIGGSLTSRVSVAAELSGVIHSEWFRQHEYTFYSSQILLGMQYWLSRRLWVGGGIGFGYDETEYNETEVQIVTLTRGPAFAFALQGGAELVQLGKFALDLRGRYGRTSTSPVASDHFIVLAGFTWY